MPLTLTPGTAGATIALTLAVLFVPGLLAATAIGLRGWLLAASAPMITYATVGIAGPWLAIAGIPFTGASFAAALFVVIGCCAAIGLFRRRWAAGLGPRRNDVCWHRTAQLAVITAVLAAAAIGGYTVVSGMGQLAAVPQDWDAAFHANGIRYIAETGDSSLTGMGSVNKYGDGTALFYPNAYHLIGTVIFQLAGPLTGTSIAAILNAQTLLLPGLLALSLVALIREFRGRAVLAGFAALTAIAPTTLLYASIERGPLLTFLLGLALLPAGMAVLRRLLTRPGVDTGFLAVLVLVGLLAIHPSTLFAGLLFGMPLLAQRWLTASPLGTHSRARLVRTDLIALGAVAVTTALLAAPHLIGAATRPSPGGPINWQALEDVQSALTGLLIFQHDEPAPQMWLGMALVVGVVFIGTLGELRWLVGSALLASIAWIAVATSDAPIVVALSQPLWNDPFRFMALAALPLTVLAAHGLAEVQAGLRAAAVRLAQVTDVLRRRVAAAIAVAVLVGFASVTGLFYTAPNAATVSEGYDMQRSERVSAAEVEAMRTLGELTAPGEWAMNDRFDGTVWTYAISGVRTVAAHYDRRRTSTTARLLSQRFNEYGSDAAVRAAVATLNVHWLIVGKRGFVHDKHRLPGLRGHERLPFLTKVYENDGAIIYRLNRSATRYELSAPQHAASTVPR